MDHTTRAGTFELAKEQAHGDRQAFTKIHFRRAATRLFRRCWQILCDAAERPDRFVPYC